jgi:D-alanine--poly(phosphoribitol) ligase subunit 1
LDVNFNLALPFYRSAQRYPHHVALWIEGRTWTYAELAGLAQRIAGWLSSRGPAARVGILASRSMETYAGILGTLWASAAYFPLSPKWPAERLGNILARTRLDALIVDEAGWHQVPALAQWLPQQVLCGTRHFSAQEDGIRTVTFEDLPPFNAMDEPRPIDRDALVYVIFTSGTTGLPKGVMIAAGNVRNFVAAIQERYPFQPDDRVAQPSEVSFDNSVFDLFNAWEGGSALYVVPASQLLGPIRFLRENAITVWYSVPSFAVSMQRMKMLPPGALPSIRYSAFAGEALPAATAEAWRQAACNSILDCLYGPTETTVVCTGDRYSDEPHITPSRGIVSIGTAFPGMEAAIFNEAQNPLADNVEGELAFCGEQVAKGYFEDDERTRERFPIIDGRRWYLTGDRAYRDGSGRYHHLGRTDNQVKIAGNRVELEEVEAHLRVVSACDCAAAVAWPVQHGTASRLTAFVTGVALSEGEIVRALRSRLPDYMVPARVHMLESIPMTSNGKIDRNALCQMLEEGALR